MIKNEEYIDDLRKIICCISKGDYYSVKELSVLRLDNLKKETILMEKGLQKYIKDNKLKKDLGDLREQDMFYILNIYMKYLFDEIEASKELKEIATIEEFIEKIK